jgi:hypothetical protein
MLNDDNDNLQDDDEQFYKETVYNEDYYIEQEQEMIRQSNLELELERLEDGSIREMREKGLLRPTLVKPSKNNPEINAPDPAHSSDDPGELPF